MTACDTDDRSSKYIIEKSDNLSYWDRRSASYSDVNKWELEGISRHMWKEVLSRNISAHYPGRDPGTLNILDVGTGPGFFSIILTELGYNVTAADFSADMLREAARNAGELAGRISFCEADAQDLVFEDGTFDIVISRNLTWNLPEPEAAYREWRRVLKPGGLLMNFDSNWYSYLFDEEARDAYERDRIASEELGLGDQNIGENFDQMEEIARKLPLSSIKRPEWDIKILSELGMEVTADEDIWKIVWTPQEQVNFASTPMFLIKAR